MPDREPQDRSTPVAPLPQPLVDRLLDIDPFTSDDYEQWCIYCASTKVISGKRLRKVIDGGGYVYTTEYVHHHDCAWMEALTLLGQVPQNHRLDTPLPAPSTKSNYAKDGGKS